jgi:hypothetical protein
MNVRDRRACEATRRWIESKLVDCRRLERPLAASEHVECPYCFGSLGEIAEGRHECFCDFRKGRDPVHFGFPEGNVRDVEG